MTLEQLHKHWLAFNKFQRRREYIYTPKINNVLKAQVQQFIDEMKKGTGQATAIAMVSPNGLFILLKQLYTEAATIYGASMVAQLPKKKARMPIGFNERMVELMTIYFQTELLNTVQDITATTREKIAEIFIKAYPLGLSYDEIVKQLEALDFTKIRARLIARTETVTASNAGAMIAVKASGLELNKIWSSAQDNRTRRTPRDRFDHLDMNGVEIPYDDMFIVNGELLAQPGDRKNGASAGNICNCRCCVVFRAVE